MVNGCGGVKDTVKRITARVSAASGGKIRDGFEGSTVELEQFLHGAVRLVDRAVGISRGAGV
jgi:hypothetical protein